MTKQTGTVDAVAQLFGKATQEVIGSATGEAVSYAKTLQKIPQINLRPDIGCFILFSGDYFGLMVMNFTGAAALEIYRRSMLKMGLPEEELAVEYTSDDVVNSIGELINQVIGKVRFRIEQQYQLVAHNTQPRAIALSTTIILNIESREPGGQDLCRRLSFKINRESFYVELSLEQSEFVRFDGSNPHEPQASQQSSTLDFEALQEASTPAPEPKTAAPELDFEALAAQNQPAPTPDLTDLDFEALQKAALGD